MITLSYNVQITVNSEPNSYHGETDDWRKILSQTLSDVPGIYLYSIQNMLGYDDERPKVMFGVESNKIADAKKKFDENLGKVIG